MRHRIKLMWDYGCWPLWQHDGQIFDNVDPATFPLSEPTRARLEAWSAIPDAKLAEVEYPPDMKWTAEEDQNFEAEGRALWLILQRELGPDYHVVYHSTSEGRVLLPEDESAA
jgi:hypothetical protein